MISSTGLSVFGRRTSYIHSSFEKSIIIERTIQQYIKDRTEGFDDYFPMWKEEV